MHPKDWKRRLGKEKRDRQDEIMKKEPSTKKKKDCQQKKMIASTVGKTMHLGLTVSYQCTSGISRFQFFLACKSQS
jgi:hypothetical protein